jgi:H+/Cl- antiporter ClcA
MHSVTHTITTPRAISWFTLALVTILVGMASGLGGMGLGLLLHLVQHLAYGYGLHTNVTLQSFFEGVRNAPPLRRFLALSLSGIVAGCGWWALYRFGAPLVSIRKAISEDGPRMPFLTTIANDLLQIVTVGLGSPLGRETAPREFGAICATWLCERAKLPSPNRRILIACGAGAGLAAVYNVPLSGALFTLEALLGTFSFSTVVPALTTSIIATMVAWIGLGNVKQYTVPDLSFKPSLIVWSVIAGPIIGFAAYWFVRLSETAQKNSPKNWKILLWCIPAFAGIGLLAIYFPQLPGNGKGLIQFSFDAELTIKIGIILLVLRLLVTTVALRAGAGGGLLTPGLTIGALLGTIGGVLWNHVWTTVPISAFALVGATAFLATSMKMPLTAIALGFEFTRVGHDFLIPMSLAVVGSASVGYICEHFRQHRRRQ